MPENDLTLVKAKTISKKKDDWMEDQANMIADFWQKPPKAEPICQPPAQDGAEKINQ